MAKEDHYLRKARGSARDYVEAVRRAKIEKRRRQLEEVRPILLSMPWRGVVAGRSRLSDIEEFLGNFEMYAPLLARHKETLAEARDSGVFELFDLYAAADLITVEGIDEEGNRSTVAIVPGSYWGDEYSYSPVHHFLY